MLRWKHAKNGHGTPKRSHYSHVWVKPGKVSWKNSILMDKQKLAK